MWIHSDFGAAAHTLGSAARRWALGKGLREPERPRTPADVRCALRPELHREAVHIRDRRPGHEHVRRVHVDVPYGLEKNVEGAGDLRGGREHLCVEWTEEGA